MGGGIWCFNLKLNLSPYGFDQDARIRVDAWRKNAFQRWDWGTVGGAADRNGDARILRGVPKECQFRVSVIAGDGTGRLLGVAHPRPRLPVESLLPLVADDLGGELWHLDYGEGDDMVVLKVNRELPDFAETVRGDPAFRALVMPQVMRSILERALLVERVDPGDGEGRWAPWFDLAAVILPNQEPPWVGPEGEDDAVARADAWIHRVVSIFSAKRVEALQSYRRSWRTK